MPSDLDQAAEIERLKERVEAGGILLWRRGSICHRH